MWYAPLPSIHSFPTRRSSDLHISALGALNGEEKWVQSIVDLMQACDDSIPDPVRETDKPFLMPIEDIFTITGRGTVRSEEHTSELQLRGHLVCRHHLYKPY